MEIAREMAKANNIKFADSLEMLEKLKAENAAKAQNVKQSAPEVVSSNPIAPPPPPPRAEALPIEPAQENRNDVEQKQEDDHESESSYRP
jgi:hypothetical protein